MTSVQPQPVARVQASPLEWVQVALLVGNIAWTTLCLGGYRAETMVVTSILTAALLGVHLGGGAFENANRRAHVAGWLLMPFLVYAAVNAKWITPVPWLGWRDWLGWAQMIAVFWVVLNGIRSRRSHAVIWIALFVLAVIAVLLAVYQRFGDSSWLMLGRTQSPQFAGRASGPFGVPNSLAALLILLLPVALAATLRPRATAVKRIGFGYVTALLAFGLVLTISRGAWLALAVTLAAWPLIGFRGSRMRRVAWAAGIAVLLALTASVLFTQVPAVRDRLVQMRTNLGERSRPIMWRAAWEIFREHPVVGGGAGSYNIRFDQHRREDFQDEPVWAHNDYLNTLSDYGTVGFVLFFGAIAGVVTVTAIKRKRSGSLVAEAAVDRPWWVGPAIAGLAAFALQLLVEFHFKIPALGLIVATISALVVQTLWTEERLPMAITHVRRALLCFVAVVVITCSIGLVLPIYRAEALRQRARQPIDRFLTSTGGDASAWRKIVDSARNDLARAVVIDPTNGAAWADFAYVLALSVRFEPARAVELGHEAQMAAEHALACSPAVAEFWIRRGVARDLQGFWIEAGGDYVTALRLAPTKGLVWYYHAVHMTLDPNNKSLALASLQFCLRLDPGNRQAQALLQRLADGSRASISSSHAPD